MSCEFKLRDSVLVEYVADTKTVVLPDFITEISDYAFRGRKSLESVTIPACVKVIGMCAFDDCPSLKTIRILGKPSVSKDSFPFDHYVDVQVECAAERNFLDDFDSDDFDGGQKDLFEFLSKNPGRKSLCKGVSFYDLVYFLRTPPSSIDPVFFRLNPQFSSVHRDMAREERIAKMKVLANSFSFIDGNRISCTAGELAEITADSIEADEIFLRITGRVSCGFLDEIRSWIAASAFNGKVHLDISQVEGLSEIGAHAFSCNMRSEKGFGGLLSVQLPASVRRIGVRAFSGCRNLESVVIPEGVTEIATSAFACCFSLRSVIFPESLAAIGDCAFRDCFSLEQVSLPEKPVSLDSSAFSCRYPQTSRIIMKRRRFPRRSMGLRDYIEPKFITL